jgi:HK97 family phage major capsid protein
MRAVEGSTFPHERANREDVQGHVARLIERHGSYDGGEIARRILATGSPTYKRAFGKVVVGAPLTDSETRALSLTGASGGYAVPYTLDPTIIPTSNGAVNPLRQISRVETISGSNTWRGVSSGAVTASRDAELSEVSDDTPTLAQPEVTVTKAAVFIPFSTEVGQDWGSLQSEMARLIQDAKDTEEATGFVTGAGTTVNPQGIVTGATGTVAAGTAAFTVAHLYALQEALAPRFEPNARFIGHNAQFNRVRQFDTSGGASLWEYLGKGTPAELLGYPAHKVSTMDSVLTAGSELLIFGDFSYFLIVDRIGLDIELIPHLFGTTNGRPTGQRGLYATYRNSSKVLSASAFKTLVTT